MKLAMKLSVEGTNFTLCTYQYIPPLTPPQAYMGLQWGFDIAYCQLRMPHGGTVYVWSNT